LVAQPRCTISARSGLNRRGCNSASTSTTLVSGEWGCCRSAGGSREGSGDVRLAGNAGRLQRRPLDQRRVPLAVGDPGPDDLDEGGEDGDDDDGDQHQLEVL